MIAEIAEAAFASVLGADDLAPGEALAVHGTGGEIDYWLVPGLRAGRLAALARVFPDGRLATVGEAAGDVAEAVTGLTAERAAGIAAEHGSEAVLVHDGPVAREAWLVGEADGKLVLATGGGTYERRAEG